MGDNILAAAEEWLKPLKDRQDPHTKLIRQLTEEVLRLQDQVSIAEEAIRSLSRQLDTL